MTELPWWMPTATLAALIAALASLIVAWVNRRTALDSRDEQTRAELKILSKKVDADYQLALRRTEAEVAASMGERAWSDYELRRDAYVRLAQLIGCLFEGGDAGDRPEFHRVARQVRIVGSDEVVSALNAFTASVREGGGSSEESYRALFNAMRRDIRRIHTLPPEGTDLSDDAFPIES